MQALNDATGRVARIPEIVEMIFATMDVSGEVEDASDSSNVKIALGRAAQTCRDFCPVALDILWKNMSSIVPLLAIIGLVKGIDGRYTLQWPESLSAQWDRLEMYAHRIKHLNDSNPPAIDDLVALRIAQHMRGKSLLPVLESLSYTFSPHLYLLISPRLRELTIKTDSDDSQLENWKVVDFFHALTVEAPMLERFISAGSWIQAVPFSISQLQHLHHMTLSDNVSLDKNTLVAVLALPKLRHLGIRFRHRHPRLSPPPSNAPSSSLRLLIVTGAPLIILDILSYLTTTPLTHLDLRPLLLNRDSPEQSWRAIASHFPSWSQSLEAVWVRSQQGRLSEAENPSQDMSILEPLLKLKVRSVNIQYPLFLDPSDKDYLNLAVTWPQVDYLALTLASASSKPRASFSTLESFAGRCPRLRYLAVHVDLSSLPQSPPISSHRLSKLSTHSAVLCEPAVLARYLNALFPSLDAVVFASDYPKWDGSTPGDRNQTQWKKVEAMLKLFQAAREDDTERRRRAGAAPASAE